MGVLLKLFDDYYPDKKVLPSSIEYNSFDIDLIDDNFIVSKTLDGKTISKFKDDIWDFYPYISNPSQVATLNFKLQIAKQNVLETKKLILLLMLFGSGRNGSQYSVASLRHYFIEVFSALSKYSRQQHNSIKNILSSGTLLLKFINSCIDTRFKVIMMQSLLNFLHNQQNSIIKIPYQQNHEIMDLLHQLYCKYDITKQTNIIPSRILFESIKQRWEQITIIEKYLPHLLNFTKEYLEADQYSLTKKEITKKYGTYNPNSWADLVHKHNLSELFSEYSANNRLKFANFIVDIQATIKHLILAYSGMRNGEVLNLQTNCLVKKELKYGICKLISTTTKLTGTKQTESWVTTTKIEKAIFILRSFNQIIADYYNADINTMPLFVSTKLLLNKYNYSANTIIPRPRFPYTRGLKLDYNKFRVTIDDKKELENIEFNITNIDINVGDIWRFKSHQYRRSLAVYSIQSGLVSLGALQIQLKHQFREMTLYYSNGASYAKQLFDIPKDHIANDIKKLKPEIDALSYIKDVIFSEDELFGGHGLYTTKNPPKESLNIFLNNNKKKIIKLFENGDLAYTATALGGCVSTEACDALLTRSLVSCGNCTKSIIKKSKLNHLIQKEKEFIEFLDKDSIEYRTEVKDLEELENQKRLFLGSEE